MNKSLRDIIICIAILVLLGIVAIPFVLKRAEEIEKLNTPISIKTDEVEVVIVDTYYDDEDIVPMICGDMTIMQTYPAVYEVTVMYEDVTYTFKGEDFYNKYKDKVGASTTGILETKTYSDGSVLHNLINLL